MQAPIKDLCEIQLGMQFRGRIEPDPKGSHDVILIRNISADKQLKADDEEDGVLTSITPQPNAERYRVNPGDVLFLARGQHNYAVAISRELERPTIVPSFFFILKPRPKATHVLPEYLAWAINRPKAQEYFHQKARRGSHMPLVGKADVQELAIPVPSIEVQRTIMDLDSLALRERTIMTQIAELNQRKIRAACERAISA